MGNTTGKLDPNDVKDLHNQTKFTAKEIKEWYKGFKLDYPDGYLTKQQFEEIYGNFYPGGNASAFAENTFRVFDHNGDGQIDFRELMIGLSMSSHGSYQEKMKWIFQLYDTNNNGLISKEEMTVIVKAIHEMSSGKSDDEAAQARVDKLYQKVDKDEEGQLSFNDFMALAKLDPTISNVLTGDMSQY